MKTLSWINVVLGAWLIVTGFVVSAGSGPVMAEEIIVGCIIACLAWITTSRPNPVANWLVALAGLWTLLAPQFISYAGRPRARATDVLIGIVVLILGVIHALYRRRPARTAA